jgi:hypothetical protein
MVLYCLCFLAIFHMSFQFFDFVFISPALLQYYLLPIYAPICFTQTMFIIMFVKCSILVKIINSLVEAVSLLSFVLFALLERRLCDLLSFHADLVPASLPLN